MRELRNIAGLDKITINNPYAKNILYGLLIKSEINLIPRIICKIFSVIQRCDIT